MAHEEISKKEMDQLGLFASILGHVGDGNFHESILYNTMDPKEKESVRKCVHDMVNRALEMEGTCTVRGLIIDDDISQALQLTALAGRTWRRPRKEAISRQGAGSRDDRGDAEHQARPGSSLAHEPGQDHGRAHDGLAKYRPRKRHQHPNTSNVEHTVLSWA